jgi:hypothetical protein
LPVEGEHRFALALGQALDGAPDALGQLGCLSQLVGASGTVGPVAREGQRYAVAA